MVKTVATWMVLLAMLIMSVPMVPEGACHEGHEVDHETDCPCFCCATPVTDFFSSLVVECASIARRMSMPEVQCYDLIMASDIFRPPASV